MKQGFWFFFWAVVVVTALTLLMAPVLRAQQRRLCQCRQVQPPEAQVLLRQEWARAHARPMH